MTMRKRLYHLQKTYRRAGVTAVGRLKRDSAQTLSDESMATREVKFGEDETLEIIADIWAFVHENMEREEWKSYTREEWQELERNYVERANYTEPDLFDDILTAYENGMITADEARAKAKEYRKCRYRFCENVFKYKRSNQYYCPEFDCRKREANAKIRFENTGTYLPPHVYKENRDDTDKENYESKEIAFNMSETGEGDESIGDMLFNMEHKRRYGGKRDRVHEAVYYKEVTEKDLRKDEISPVIRHYNHVYNREAL